VYQSIIPFVTLSRVKTRNAQNDLFPIAYLIAPDKFSRLGPNAEARFVDSIREKLDPFRLDSSKFKQPLTGPAAHGEYSISIAKRCDGSRRQMMMNVDPVCDKAVRYPKKSFGQMRCMSEVNMGADDMIGLVATG
jgi:hypothetical protein